MNRVIMALVVGLLAGAAISACVVDREGAPCDRDDNCPRSQYCDLGNHCVELTPALEANVACRLVLVSLTQKFSECLGGRPQDWLEGIFPDQICGTYLASLAAGRVTYDPMQLKVCRAALFTDACADLGTRKAGRMLADCPLFAGTVAPASPCATDKDCAGGYCDTTSGCPGTCRAFVAENAPCTAADVCTPETACTGGTCRRYITSGPCSADAGPCQPFSNYCNGSGQCVPRAVAGTPGCNYAGAGYFCEQNLNCVGALLGGKSCLRGVGLDQPCTPFTNACDKFSACMTRDGGATLCTPLPGPGGGCGLSPPAGAQDLILACRQSRCVLLSCVNYLSPGQACNNDGECGPLARCVGGTCRAEFCP